MEELKKSRAYIDDYQLITVYLGNDYYNGDSDFFYLTDNEARKYACSIFSKEVLEQKETRYKLNLSQEIEVGKAYTIYDEHGQAINAEYRLIVKAARFDEENSYLGDDLGAKYERNKTTFVFWAPTSQAAKLRIFKKRRCYEFPCQKDGSVFRVSIKGNWQACSYLYLLERNGLYYEVVDPYALSLSANGGYAVVINPKKVAVNIPRLTTLEDYVDHIIYEISVRDMTIDENARIRNAGKYLGLCETATKYKEQATGFDYIKSLGVTMIQLMPVLDFVTVDELNPLASYNWGYDPGHYLALEGSYSTDANKAYSRVIEFKELVASFHRANLAVSLDVVFNHVYQRENSNLEKLLPYYFFRMDDEANLSNGSFCGNDYESRSIMGRKYLVDCCMTLVKEYDVDAFRFDLMSIIDLETMKTITTKLRELKENFMIYGEGWDMPTMLDAKEKSSLLNREELSKVAFFSERFRDVVKGPTNKEAAEQRGYGSNNTALREAMKNAFTASTVAFDDYPLLMEEPQQVINYAECHDNLTLWDKLAISCQNESEQQRVMRQKLITACVLLAQGVPFLHSGQEFCRTKYFDENSYRSGDDVNKIDYARMLEYFDVVNYCKDMIKLRREFPHFRLSSKSAIHQGVSFENLDQGSLRYNISLDGLVVDCFINPSLQTLSYEYEKPVRILANEAGYLTEAYNLRIVTINPITVVVTIYEQ